jgi:tetratricopeptide (TPR) repeat protein
MKLGTTGLLAAVMAMGLAAAAEAQDIIRLKSGTEIKAKVTAMTSQSVTYTETGGKVSTAKREDVVSVDLGDKPPSLVKADQALSELKFEKAINNYQPALEEIQQKKARDLNIQFVLYNWAQALNQKGSPAEALEMLRRLRNECKDCWLRADSYQRSMDIAKAKGGDAYESILKEMKSEPEPVGSQAEVELAKIKFTGGDFDSARPMFDKVASNPASPYAGEAKLWSLRCIRGLKKPDELESACTRILGDKAAATPGLLQAAGACLAEIQLKKSEKDKTKWRDILMLSLQSIAQGPPSAKDDAEDYVLALMVGAKCYVLISNDAEKPDAKEDYKNRAIAYYKEVQRGYAKSTMAEAATKELVALGAEVPKDAPPKNPGSSK